MEKYDKNGNCLKKIEDGIYIRVRRILLFKNKLRTQTLWWAQNLNLRHTYLLRFLIRFLIFFCRNYLGHISTVLFSNFEAKRSKNGKPFYKNMY